MFAHNTKAILHQLALITAFSGACLTSDSTVSTAAAHQATVEKDQFRPTHIITWGDSVANGIGALLKQRYDDVINLGVDGAGLRINPKTKPYTDIPKDSFVIIHMMGNDVSLFVDKKNPKLFQNYAQKLVDIAKEIKANGSVPVIMAHKEMDGNYTGNKKWTGNYYQRWNKAMKKLNNAISKQAAADDISFVDVESRIPDKLRFRDNLHYTCDGYKALYELALEKGKVNAEHLEHHIKIDRTKSCQWLKKRPQ